MKLSTLRCRGGFTLRNASSALLSRLTMTCSRRLASPTTVGSSGSSRPPIERSSAQQLARGREPALLLGPVAQHARHMIEMGPDRSQLIVPGHRDLRTQVAFRDTPDGALDFGERRPDPPSHDEQRDRQQHRADNEHDHRHCRTKIPRQRECHRRAVHHRRDDDAHNQHTEATRRIARHGLISPFPTRTKVQSMRSFGILLTFVVLGAAACSHATARQSAPAPAPARQDTSRAVSGRQQVPDQGAPKPYDQVITAGAITDAGVFTVHRIGEKLFYEIPKAMFGRASLMVPDQRGTIRGVRYAGEEISNRIVKWERMGNKVFLRIVSYAMRADSTQPVARAVRLSNIAPIIMSFDVASWHTPDSAAVIETTKLFTTDVAELNLHQLGMRIRRMDPSRSVVDRARSFPRNVEVSALQTFEVDSVPGPAGAPPTRSLNSITMLMNYSMVLLPDKPMMARLCDDRVGYFNRSLENYDEDRVSSARRCFIQRYRLEPKDPNAAVSDP